MLEIDYKYVHELFDLNPEGFEMQTVSNDYHRLHDIFDAKYNIRDFNFSFDVACTFLIEALFKKYVTPQTIIISSKRDHLSVQKCLNRFECKELIYLDEGPYLKKGYGPDANLFRNSKDFSIRKLADRLAVKDYNNIFFLSYGTCVNDGEIRENDFFKKIFKICETNCDNVTKILDDCQGSMWIDRDYSLYDYVLWTAHATLLNFDCGVLLSKPNMPILGVYDVGEEFLYDNYRRLLERKDFATSFNKQLSLATGVHLSSAPHIFSIKLKKDYPQFPEIAFADSSNLPYSSVTPVLKVEASRFARLRVETFVNNDGKYRMLKILRHINRIKEDISEENFVS